MKKLKALFFILILSFNVNAQKKLTSQDSIKIFYDAIFNNLKSNYMLRKSVDWKLVELQTGENLEKCLTFRNSLQEIKTLFDKIGATHCSVYYEQKKYAATTKIISKDDYSQQWKRKYDSKPGFDVKVLSNNYGYILIPPMSFSDISATNIHKIAQPLYDRIAVIKTQNKIDGWIIDLRFNSGGNSWPMLLALYDLLGDNDVGGSLNASKKQESKFKLDNGKLLEKSQTISYIEPIGALADKTKVAVITGRFTASSGEVVALAFKGRENTKFIGERTYGATTGNVYWPLPFDSYMALTTSYDSDRNGKYYEQLIPDVILSKEDDFDNLLLDRNIQEAIKFINL